MKEIWKHVPDTNEKYEVSSLGNLRSYVRRGRRGNVNAFPVAINPYIAKNGYSYVTLRCVSGQKKWLVHRLVITVFLEPSPSKWHHCAHLNGNQSDNRLSNLEWVTPEVNCSHKIIHGTALKGEDMPCAKLTEEMVRELRRSDKSALQLSRELGLSRTTIRHAISGITWKHVS